MTEAQNYRDRKYRDDTVFQLINKKFLTLPEEERRRNNEHLKTVVEQIFIPLMRKDELFNLMYKRIMYGGSYYKGTKYGRPEEFDLDFVIKLPISYEKITIDTDHDNYGFVKIKINTDGPLHVDWQKYSKVLSKWLTDDNYLDQNKFRYWMESIFTTAFLKLNRNSDGYYEMQYGGKTYTAKHKKSGPAFTILINTPEGSSIDVDLVPSLVFDGVPLGNGYKSLYGNRKSWMVVAKPVPHMQDGNILWRLCFYEQEKEFLKGDLKPVIRMMKKFRDSMGWDSIASYFIETIYFHELENYAFDLQNFLKAPKTWLFILGLKKLKDALTSQRLTYFWHANYNLFGKIKSAELQCYANKLQKIITTIDNKIETDRFILADIVLNTKEARSLRIGGIEEDISNLEISKPEESRCILL